MEDVLEDHAIIIPPKLEQINLPKRKYKYIIDSRDRNTDRYPNPARYDINLDEEITDVLSIELLVSDFKFNTNNVTRNNCIFHMNELEYVIPCGLYTGEEIAEAIKQLTSIDVKYHSITHKITIISNEGCELNFQNEIDKKLDDVFVKTYNDKSIARLLGFEAKTYTLGAGEHIEAPYTVDLEPDSYITMYLQKAKNYLSQNPKANHAYAIITRNDTRTQGINIYNGTTVKYFNPPIPSLKNLSFKFFDYDGNLYDFENKNHRMELLFTCFRQTRCYNEIFK